MTQTECDFSKLPKHAIYLEVVRIVANFNGVHKSLQKFSITWCLEQLPERLITEKYFNREFSFSILTIYFRTLFMLRVV